MDACTPETQTAGMSFPWFFLRDGTAPSAAENLIDVLVVGDVMLGRGVASNKESFTHVAARLRCADLTIGNFEGAIPALDQPLDEPVEQPDAPYRLLIPETAAAQLRSAGFDVLSLANNHSLDAGASGLLNTISVLKAAGMTSIGAARNPNEISKPFVFSKGGIRVAILALNVIPPASVSFGRQLTPATPIAGNSGSISLETDYKSAVSMARDMVDVLIVFIHWGREYWPNPDPTQRALAGILLEAGADLVIGAHPHVVQPIEIQRAPDKTHHTRDRLIAFSLGNFVFDQWLPEARQGLALRLLLDRNGLRAAQAIPVVAGPQPRWANVRDTEDILARAGLLTRRIGFTCNAEICQKAAAPQQHPSGIFWSGSADLTGDGTPEFIQRQGGYLAIFQDGRQVWKSPPDWRVADLAPGDPDFDGREELLLALFKPDPLKGETSHPFILGYRRGSYRVLWGGSPVSEPILEVELADLDGDRRQQLVVLESIHQGDQRSVSVWRWHGWGFSLIWRSPPGLYKDLSLAPTDNGQGYLITVTQTCWQETRWVCTDYP